MTRAVAVAALLGAALLLAACATGADDRPPAAAPPPVEFSASFAEEPGVLTVTYRLRNTGDGGLVVYNGVTADAGFGDPAPDNVFVTAGADGVVEVAKRVFDVPAGVDLDARAVIRGEILPPGGETGERVRVSLPLAAAHPYGAGRAGTLPDPVRRVVFCLGVAGQSEFPERLRDGVSPPGAPSAPGPSASGGARYGYFTHPSPQRLVCSAPHELAG